jgi:hypothetical protein
VTEQTLSHYNTINEKSQGNNRETFLEERMSGRALGTRVKKRIVKLKSMVQQEG